MSELIARVYETEQKAKSVVRKLKEEGFAEGSIVKLTPESPGEGPLAAAYAEHAQQGRSLVGVRAPFGRGVIAQETLDSANPVAVVAAEAPESHDESAVDYGEGAPLSKALNLPVLKRNAASPLSDYTNWPIVSKKRHYLTTELADPHKTFTGSFLPLLSGDAAPLSAKFGWKVSSDNPAPLSAKAGMSTLSNDATPLSSKFGISVLSDNPAPLSSKFGLSLLSHHR